MPSAAHSVAEKGSLSQTKSAVMARGWSHMLPRRRTAPDGTACFELYEHSPDDDVKRSDWRGQRLNVKQCEHYLVSHSLQEHEPVLLVQR